MEAKETRMDELRLWSILEGEKEKPNRSIILALKQARNEQAEVSFKAGWQEGWDSAKKELETNPEILRIAREELNAQKQVGIREVVEWIPELIQAIKDKMWEDDWGVKGVIYEGQLDALVKRLVKVQKKEWGINDAD